MITNFTNIPQYNIYRQKSILNNTKNNSLQNTQTQNTKNYATPTFNGSPVDTFKKVQTNITAGFNEAKLSKLVDKNNTIVEKLISLTDKTNRPMIKNGTTLENCVEAAKIDDKKLKALLDFFNKDGESIFVDHVEKFFHRVENDKWGEFADVKINTIKDILKLDPEFNHNDVFTLIKPFQTNKRIITEMSRTVDKNGNKVFTVPEMAAYSKIYENDKKTVIDFAQLRNSRGLKLVGGGFENKNFIENILPNNVQVFKQYPKDYADLAKRDFGLTILQNEDFVSKYHNNKDLLNEIPQMEIYDGRKKYSDPRDMVDLADLYIEDSANIRNMVKNIHRDLRSAEIKTLNPSYKKEPNATKVLMEMKISKVDPQNYLRYFEPSVEASEVEKLLEDNQIVEIANQIAQKQPQLARANKKLSDLEVKMKNLELKLKREQDTKEMVNLGIEKVKLSSQISDAEKECRPLESELRSLNKSLNNRIMANKKIS